MSQPHIVILGAGPAGAGAAYRLRELDRARVTLVEQKDAVGGNAGSFDANGQRLDYGSHRLHPASDPEILDAVRQLLGDDLLDRPRHGRIHLRGKLIHFPLKPDDLLLRLDRAFAAGVMRDMVTRRFARNGNGNAAATFASVLQENLGRTICSDFYFPYARKIWGREPEELSAIQARRRVSAGSFGKLIKKVLSAVPGLKPPGAGRFFYPRRGFGQITEAFAEGAQSKGADVRLNTRVTRLERAGNSPEAGWRVTLERSGASETLEADYVWSTLPVSLLARMVTPAPPQDVVNAAASLSYRAMLLVYLELDVDRFTEYDAHYFPAADIAITRLSEPKNYAALSEPRGRTTLCAELPCDVGDKYWNMTDEELGKLVAADLARAGLPVPGAPRSVHVRRLSHAYPIYVNGYEKPFSVLDSWADSMPRLLTYGRQGLFAHDNTHHALFMAYRAVDCLVDGRWSEQRWADARKIFESHVVED